MAHFTSLTVLIPMWNEEEGIGEAVAAARASCRQLDSGEVVDTWEILIVDDASTDQTGPLADEFAAADEHVRVIHHDANRGLGGALKTGFQAAQGELILYTDADLPVELGEVQTACRQMQIENADIVSAQRRDRSADGWRRTAYTLVYNWLVRVAFRLPVGDVNCPFKLMQRRILRHVVLQSEGSFIDAELLIRAHRLGLRIVQFPVDYRPRTRGVSSLSSLPVIRKILIEAITLFMPLRRVRRLPDAAIDA